MAAVDTWTGGGGNGNWSNGPNWSGGVPVANDILVFTGGTQPATTNDLAINPFDSINFTATTAVFSIVGNSLTLSPAVSTNGITVAASAVAGTYGIGNDIDFMSNLSLNNSGPFPSVLLLGGVLSGGGNVALTGARTVQYGGANTYNGTTTINNGTLQAGAQNTFSPNSPIIGTGGELDLNNFNQSIPTLSGTIFVTNLGSGTLTLTGSGSQTLNTNMVGSGGFTLDGSIDLTIMAPVAHGLNNTGPTTINGGNTLEARAGFAGVFAFESEHILNGNGTLKLNNTQQIIGSLSSSSLASVADVGSGQLDLGEDNTSTTFAGSIQGTGTLVKVGSGTFTLAGTNTLSGLTTISGGILIVNGSLGGGVAVGAGTILKGTGSVAGNVNVNNGGTIQPGNSIGSITVGSLTLNSSSNVDIEIDPTSASQIISTGAANLAGALNVIVDAGSYSNQTYTIITASSVSGTFSSLNAAGPGLRSGMIFSVVYDPTLVQLVLIAPFIPPQSLTGNNLILANYLNSISNLPGIAAILDKLSVLSGDALTDALESISPARNAGATFFASNLLFEFEKILAMRFSKQRFAPAPSFQNPDIAFLETSSPFRKRALPIENEDRSSQREPCLAPPKRKANTVDLWVDGFGVFSHQKAKDQNPSFSSTAGGLFLAADYLGLNETLIGGGVGYARDAIRQGEDLGKDRIDLFAASLFALTQFHHGYFEFALWGSYEQYLEKRNVFFPGFFGKATSNHHGWQVMPYAGLGYDIEIGCWAGLEFFATGQWVVNFEEGFTERGAGVLDMVEKSRNSSMLRAEAGVEAYQTVQGEDWVLLFTEGASYVFKRPFHIGKVNAAIVGAPTGFTVNSFTDTQNLVAPYGEIIFNKEQIYFGGSYYGEFGSGYRSNTVQGMLGYFF